MNAGPVARLGASGRLIVAGVGIAVFGLLGTRSLGYLAFVVLALMPTFAAAILEKRGQRAATISIGSMTVATLLPLVLGAIANGSSRDLLHSGSAWTFVAGAVLGGAAIYFVLPTMTVWMEESKAQSRLRHLRERQQKLEKDWGTEVRTNVAN